MRTLQPGFDPFQRNGWIPFEAGGIKAVEEKEAPLLMYALDVAEPDMAQALAKKYADEGLEPTDLRFGVWVDAKPQPKRTAEDIATFGGPAVHLNVFGGRQIRYDQATGAERSALDALTFVTEMHVREVLFPAPVTVQSFNERAPTPHRHIIAREKPEDGLDWTRERPLIDLYRRRAVAERVTFDLMPYDGAKTVKDFLRATLEDCLTRPRTLDYPYL